MRLYYLDNAASTPLHEEVIKTMEKIMQLQFGNPSAAHSLGRAAKSTIEQVRKQVSEMLHCEANEIVFTSGGTEANNLILRAAVHSMDVKRIITQPIEHKCILETVFDLAKNASIVLEMLPVNEKGNIDYYELEKKLQESSLKTLVSITHGNNEIGNLLDLDMTVEICHRYGALFHSDTVQTLGHYAFNLKELPVDFIAGSAHKFHGPKGAGFAFIRKAGNIHAVLTGGNQERGKRAGTENIYGVAGLGKALEIAYKNLEADREKIETLKCYAIEQFKTKIPDCFFIGESENLEKSLYTILNVGLKNYTELLPFELDLRGIAVSQGSACQSGAVKKSHVISTVLSEEKYKDYTNLRISFSIYNTKKEIDFLIQQILALA